MSAHPVWSRAGVLVLSALVLSGCSPATDDTPEAVVHVEAPDQVYVPGSLPPMDLVDDGYGPILQWARPDMLVLTTFGSSSCPDRVQDLSVREDGIQQVVLADPAAIHGACTADLAPRHLQVPVLDEATDSGELTVWVRYAGESYGQVTEFSMGAPPGQSRLRLHTPNAGG